MKQGMEVDKCAVHGVYRHTGSRCPKCAETQGYQMYAVEIGESLETSKVKEVIMVVAESIAQARNIVHHGLGEPLIFYVVEVDSSKKLTAKELMKALTARRKKRFMEELTRLSKAYGVYIRGCGCCGSPELTAEEPKTPHGDLRWNSCIKEYMYDSKGS